jgi:molecular chaperone GrpE
MSDGRDELLDPDIERASEIDDLTGPVPRVGGPADRHPDTETVEELVEDFEIDLDALLAEREQFKSIAQRLQADFDNYRKRVQAQSADEVDRATGRLAEAFLPVLDAAEAAYVRHPDEVGPLLNVMLTELKKHGLETLDLDGQPFDPEVAEAVAHEPGDGGDVVVAEVLRSGYRWKGRTLRPAMVRTRG